MVRMVFLVSVFCAAIVIRALFFNAKPGARSERDRTGSLIEGALILSFLILPPATFVLITLMHGAMHDRYVLATVLGMALAISYVKPTPKGPVILVLAFFGLLVGARELLFWKTLDLTLADRPAAQVESFIGKGGHLNLPVVVSEALVCLPLDVYASPEWKTRFVYLVDEQKALAYVGSDTIDKTALSRNS